MLPVPDERRAAIFVFAGKNFYYDKRKVHYGVARIDDEDGGHEV